MTSIEARYRLLKCVALGGGVRTHNAQEASTGRPVMVHILDGAEPDAAERLREQIIALPVADRARILEVTMAANGFAVVSEFLPGLTTFPEWLDARAPLSGPLPVIDAELPPPGPNPTTTFTVGTVSSSRDPEVVPAPPPGEFTRLFQLADEPASSGAPMPPPQPKAPATPPSNTAAAPAPAAAAVPNAASPLATPPAPRGPASTPPSVRTVVQPSAPVSSPPPVPPSPPVVVAPVIPPPVAPPRVAASAAAPEPSALKPGEFTALFRPAVVPAPNEIAPSPLVGAPKPPQVPSFGPPPAAPRAPYGAGSGYGAPSTPPFGASSSGAFAAPAPASPDPDPALGTPLGSASPAARVHLAWSPPASAPTPPTPPAPATPPPAFGPPPLAPRPATPSPLGVSPSPFFGGAPEPAPLPPVIAPPVFGAPGALGSSGAGAAPSPLGSERGGGPSDYTMLIRQSATPAPPAPGPAATPVKPAAPTKRSVPLGLIISLNVVLVLAIALVLYFVFRPPPPSAEPGGPLPDPASVKAPTATVPAAPKAPTIPKATIPAAPAVRP